MPGVCEVSGLHIDLGLPEQDIRPLLVQPRHLPRFLEIDQGRLGRISPRGDPTGILHLGLLQQTCQIVDLLQNLRFAPQGLCLCIARQRLGVLAVAKVYVP